MNAEPAVAPSDGLAVAVGERAILDLAWRYTDLGKIRTDRGPGRVIWRDGSREPLPLDPRADRGATQEPRRAAVAALQLLRTGPVRNSVAAATLGGAGLQVVAPVGGTCYSIREADGLREIRSAWMNKSELAERLAGRTGMSKAAAKDAVNGVFETIGDALANGEEARILGFCTFGNPEPAGAHRVATRGQARPCRSPLRRFLCSRRAAR